MELRGSLSFWQKAVAKRFCSCWSIVVRLRTDLSDVQRIVGFATDVGASVDDCVAERSVAAQAVDFCKEQPVTVSEELDCFLSTSDESGAGWFEGFPTTLVDVALTEVASLVTVTDDNLSSVID